MLASHGHAVTLAIHNDPEVALEGVRQIRDDSADLNTVISRSEIVITGGGPYPEPSYKVPPGIPYVIDMSFPLVLEAFAMHAASPKSWPDARLRTFARGMADRLLSADVLLCASLEQRHFYIGCLAVLQRLTGGLARSDPALESLLKVVPFGCSATAPRSTGGGPRKDLAGISETDYVLIWSGNVADWYDPETVIRAVGMASRQLEGLRLVFIGANTKDERLGRTPTGANARRLAQELRLEGRHVFFHDDWVPYEERADWLLGSDAAVIASPKTLEAELAVRARFLDYVWCATPSITTAGGTFASDISRYQLGLVVAPGDVEGMTTAIVAMAHSRARAAMAERIRDVRPRYEWPTTLAPLVDYCRAPHLAADRDASMPRDRTHNLNDRAGLLGTLLSRFKHAVFGAGSQRG